MDQTSTELLCDENKKCKLVPFHTEKEVESKDIEELIHEQATTGQVSIQAYIPKGISAIGAPSMWNKGINGTGVLVGVVDTGIGYHPDLQNKVIISKVFTGESGAPLQTHGTHVAGTIAANGLIRGVAYGANLADYRVLSNNGSGNYDWIVAGIYNAVFDKCQVINMSLGGPVDYPPLRSAIQYAYDNNIPVIVAAGNEGDGSIYTNEYSYPAMYSTTQSIGAVDYYGTSTRPAYFTNTNYEVDCCSQGVNVISTVLGGSYAYLSGTSMATPHITGAVALTIHEFKSRGIPYTVNDIISRLRSLSKDVYIPGRDNATGSGFVTFNPTL